MKRLCEFLIFYLFAGMAYAVGPDWQQGVKDSITINCVNPTARTDGKAINWTTEGGHVDYSVGSLTGRMGQGCQSTTVDIRPLSVGQQYVTVKAYDTSERASVPSSSFAFFRSAEAAPTPETRPNLAASKVTTVSSIENSTYIGAKAVDNLMTTRWASILPGKNAEWIIVDLGEVYLLDHIIIKWQCFASAFNVQVSVDGATWATVKALTGQVASVRLEATNDVTFTPTQGRYVRVQGVTRGSQWGYSIFELMAYGDPVATPCTSAEEAACTSQFNVCMEACGR